MPANEWLAYFHLAMSDHEKSRSPPPKRRSGRDAERDRDYSKRHTRDKSHDYARERERYRRSASPPRRRRSRSRSRSRERGRYGISSRRDYYGERRDDKGGDYRHRRERSSDRDRSRDNRQREWESSRRRKDPIDKYPRKDRSGPSEGAVGPSSEGFRGLSTSRTPTGPSTSDANGSGPSKAAKSKPVYVAHHPRSVGNGS